MSEHVELHNFPGTKFDAPLTNLILLIGLSIFEIIAVFAVAVGKHPDPIVMVLILVPVAVLKFFLIPAIFMHLCWDPKIFTRTAFFPAFLLVVMLVGIAFVQPGTGSDLPGWCRGVVELPFLP